MYDRKVFPTWGCCVFSTSVHFVLEAIVFLISPIAYLLAWTLSLDNVFLARRNQECIFVGLLCQRGDYAPFLPQK